MKILALDTSGLVASVAVSEDGRLIAQFSIQYKITHSQTLMPMMQTICQMIELDLQSIDAIALAAGPGSFTGLRIGSATAKGLGLALDKPIIPVPTVDGLAYNLYGCERVICPMMDARRGQIYTGAYTFVPQKVNEAGMEQIFDMQILHEQCVISIEEMAEYLNHMGVPAVFLGDAIPVYRDRLEHLIKVPYTIAQIHQDRQNAAAVAALAEHYYQNGKIVRALDFAPEYLRASQAERSAIRNYGTDVAEEKKIPDRIFVREMRAEDVPDAALLEQKYLGKEAWTEKQILDAQAQDDTIYLIAEKAGRIIGLCGVQNISGEGEITNVSVSADSRREGVAGKMLHQLLERGKGIGITAYTLEVRAGNLPARALYERAGFRSEGIRPGFYNNPKEDAVIYWLRYQQ